MLVCVVIGCILVAAVAVIHLAANMLFFLHKYCTHHEHGVFASYYHAHPRWSTMSCGYPYNIKIHGLWTPVVPRKTSPIIVDNRSGLKMVWHRFSALCTDIMMGMTQLPHRLGICETITEVHQRSPTMFPSMLVVLVHGLRGHPSGFKSYVDEIKRISRDAMVVVPHVRNKGLCTLDEASEDITKTVEHFLDKCEDRIPVWLIGTSNGGRIVANVESKMRHRPSDIHTIIMGAPIGGSMSMSLVHAISPALAEWLFPNGLAKELHPDSVRVKQLLDAIAEEIPSASPRVKRTYACIVTLDEHNIWPPNYALPLLKCPTEYLYTYGVGHSALPTYARDYVIARMTATRRKSLRGFD